MLAHAFQITFCFIVCIASYCYRRFRKSLVFPCQFGIYLFAWLILVDLLRIRNNLNALETVDVIRIDRTGIFKTGRVDAKFYHFGWSDFAEIVRADNLHQIELNTHPDQSSIYLKSHAKDVFLIIFNEGSVDILERNNLDLGVTTKSLDYICLEVPNHQVDATENALKRFTTGKVRIRRFSQVKFDFRYYKEKYIV